MARAEILLADDDPLVRETLALSLRTLGYAVTAVDSAAAAATELERGRYDLLISDIHMPGNENLELLRSRVDAAAAVPVILITGYPAVDTAVAAVKLAVVDYLEKPVTLSRLRLSVERGLARARAISTIDRAHREALEWARWLEDLKEAIRITPSLPTPDLLDDPVGEEDVLRRLPAHERERLSPREQEVLRSLATGHRVDEISTELTISANTVRNHFRSIFSKLNVNSQIELLSKLLSGASPALGIVAPGPAAPDDSTP